MKDRQEPFRCRLERKLKNVYPDCTIEVVEESLTTVKFRLVGTGSKYKSNLVSIESGSPDVLKQSYLKQQIKWARYPDKGQPRMRRPSNET